MQRWTFSRFNYGEPGSTEEALTLLRDHPRAVIKAGGTDLLIRMRRGELDPDLVLSMRRIPGISGIRQSPEAGLWIGPNATIAELAGNQLVSRWDAVTDAADLMGNPQIRNLATVGGNVCNRSPVADVAAALMAYEATAFVEGPEGQGIVSLEDLVKGPKRAPLLLTQISLLPLQDRTVGSFLKFTRTKGDGLAVVSCALVLTMDRHALNPTRARIVFGGVAPSLIRARQAEDVLASDRITEDLIGRACDLVEKDINPIDDFRSSAEYRIHLAKVLLKRSWNRALQRLGLVTTEQASRLS